MKRLLALFVFVSAALYAGSVSFGPSGRMALFSQSTSTYATETVLLHFNDTLTDESGKTWSAAGNASFTADAKFGSGAGSMASTSHYFTTADSDDFYFGTGSFTIDAWVKITELDTLYGNTFYSQYQNSSNLILFRIAYVFGSNWQISFKVIDGGVETIDETAVIAFSAGAYHHVAVTRNANSIRLFADGNMVKAASETSAVPNISASPQIGSLNGGSLGGAALGKVDEFRIIKGHSLWDSSFTVPSSETSSYAVVGSDASVLLGN